MKLIWAIGAGALLAACATTQDQSQSAYVTDEDGVMRNAAGEEVRCERVGGSRLPGQRVCRTEEEWDRIGRDGRTTLEEMQRQPQQSPF